MDDETLDLIRSLTEALRGAVMTLDRLERRVEHTHSIVMRHDRTIRAIHQGLHQTSDPS